MSIGEFLVEQRNPPGQSMSTQVVHPADQELKDDANPESRGWFTGTLTSSGSSLALAFICTKALLPIRVPLTLAITPPIARWASCFCPPPLFLSLAFFFFCTGT